MADDQGYWGPSIYWSPAVVGAIASGKRIKESFDTKSINPRQWFTKPGEAGTVAREHAAAVGMVKPRLPDFDYIGQINKMMLESTWKRGMSDTMARRAVAEAARASLLRGAKMPMSDIEALTGRVLSPAVPLEASSVQQNIFSMASAAVRKFGDPSVFMDTMRAFTERGYKPGYFFSQQELGQLYAGATAAGRTRRWLEPVKGQWAPVLPKREVELLGGWLKQFKAAGVVSGITDIAEYPGDIRMATVGFDVPGLSNMVKLRLPLHPSRYRRGASEFIMNRIYAGLPTQGGTTTSWADYYVKQITDTLMPDLKEIATRDVTPQEVRRAVNARLKAFHEDINRYLMWTPNASHPGLDFINQVNAQTVGAPELIGFGGGRKLTPVEDVNTELAALYRQGGFWPTSAGKLRSGRLFTGFDPREMWAYGGDFPFERQPLQFAREFAPTQAALESMKRGRIGWYFRRDMPFLATARRKELVQRGLVGPQMLVGYALPKGRAEAALQKIGLAQEEALLSKDFMSMYETERLTPVKLGLREPIGSERLAKWIQQAATSPADLVAKRPLVLTPGEQLGYIMQTGKPVFAAQIPGLKQEVIGVEVAHGGTGREAAHLVIRETYAPEEMVKLFGEFRATIRARDADYLRGVRKNIGAEFLGTRFMEDIDTFVYIDELKKNRGLLRQQMVTGLGYLAEERLQNINQTYREIANMRKSGMPLEAVNQRYGELLTQTDEIALSEMERFLQMSAEDIQKMLPNELEMLRKGKQWGLDIRLMAGALPETSFLSPTEMEEARRIAGKAGLVHPSGMVLGMAAPHVGAYRHTMGGGITETGIRGSMEPRGFLQLMQHQWVTSEGDAAKLLAGEIAGRMDNYGRDMQEILNISRSMLGQQMSGLETAKAGAGLQLEKNAYMLDLGIPIESWGGASKIYVPGEDAMHRLGVFRSASGDIMQTDLGRAYNRVIRTANYARNLNNETKAVNALNSAATDFTETVMREAGAAIYGRGGEAKTAGALRGKMLGSRLLAVSSVDEMISQANADLVEVSQLAGTEMYTELEKAATAMEERNAIRDMREAFLRGEKVTGVIGRHPFIGKYGLQPINIQMATGPTTATELFVRAPARIKQAVVATGLGQIETNISPMVGLAADYDDDRLIIAMIGNQKTAKATQELLAGGTYRSAYGRFAAETSVLRELAKKQIGKGMAPALSDIESIISGSTKLRVGAEIGSISSAMTEAKLAVSQYRPELAPRFNTIAEMMEQQIISGKHMKDVSQNIARDVATSIEHIGAPGGRNVQELVDITRKLFGQELEQGIELTMSGAQPWKFQVNYEGMWNEVRTALEMGREKGGVVTAYRQMARGRIHHAKLSINEMMEMFEKASASRSDMLANLAARGVPRAPIGRMTAAVSDVLRGINTGIKELGANAKTWLRPAFWGLAGTAAAVMLLGGPRPQAMEPPLPPIGGDQRRQLAISGGLSRTMMRGIPPENRDLRPETLPIPESAIGRPTAPGMMTPSTYMTNSAPMGYRVVATGYADQAPDYDSVAQALRSITGGRGQLNVSYRDNRQKLTAQSISGLLEGF